MTETESIDYLVKSGVNKRNMLKNYPLHYFVRSMVAGAYLTVVFALCMKLGNYFNAADSPLAYISAAIAFGIALIIVIFGGAELFTSNTMYLTISTLNKKTTVTDTLKVWTTCYVGNFCGAILFAYIFYLTGIFGHNSPDHFINEVTSYKMSATTTEIFFKGILCNWLVCLACYLPIRMKNEVAKMAIVGLLVFTFFLSGFDHSIANMGLFSVALLSPHPDTITLAGAIHNIIPATFGNIIGGAVFVGMVYHFLAKTEEKQINAVKNKEEKVS